MSAPVQSSYLGRPVIKRFALIDDVHRQQLHCLVTNDLEGAVRSIPNIYGSNAGWEGHLFAVRKFNVPPSKT